MKLKKIILLSVLVLCTGQIFAEDCNFQTIGGIRYCLGDFSLVADVAPLDDDNEYFGNIVIPATVTYEGKSYKTNVIQYKAFYNCELLTSVTIPNSVWEIGQEAFSGCHNLKSVSIPNSVKRIETGAFCACYNLTSVIIPDSVYYIGSQAFFGCDALTTISIGKSVKSIEWNAFGLCPNLKSVHINDIAGWCSIDFKSILRDWDLYIKSIKVKDLVIPEGVKEIKAGAFRNCTGLTSVIIPNSVTSIGEGAFANCTNMISISIPQTTQIKAIFGDDYKKHIPNIIVR